MKREQDIICGMLPFVHFLCNIHKKRDIWPQAETWEVPKEWSTEDIKKKVEEAPAGMLEPEESCFAEAKDRAGTSAACH